MTVHLIALPLAVASVSVPLIEPPHASRKIGAPRGGGGGGHFLPSCFFMNQKPAKSLSSSSLTSVTDQIQNLVDRGMGINDPALAERCLNHIGYQRLSAYWKPFESTTPTKHGNVGNQQKWDTLRPEGSGIVWGSGERHEGHVVASSPIESLSLRLLPALYDMMPPSIDGVPDYLLSS